MYPRSSTWKNLDVQFNARLNSGATLPLPPVWLRIGAMQQVQSPEKVPFSWVQVRFSTYIASILLAKPARSATFTVNLA